LGVGSFWRGSLVVKEVNPVEKKKSLARIAPAMERGGVEKLARGGGLGKTN